MFGATTPAAFNLDLSQPPPPAGVVPQNLTSLWSWNNPLGKWHFYAPSLQAQGGNALSAYIAANGYLDFSGQFNSLLPGIGFWVNKP